jgi:hypothetical protein
MGTKTLCRPYAISPPQTDVGEPHRQRSQLRHNARAAIELNASAAELASGPIRADCSRSRFWGCVN